MLPRGSRVISNHFIFPFILSFCFLATGSLLVVNLLGLAGPEQYCVCEEDMRKLYFFRAMEKRQEYPLVLFGVTELI